MLQGTEEFVLDDDYHRSSYYPLLNQSRVSNVCMAEPNYDLLYYDGCKAIDYVYLLYGGGGGPAWVEG